MPLPSTTRFRELSRPVAVATLAATALLVAILIQLALNFRAPPPEHAGDGDLALYTRIVGDLRDGKSYYPSAHAELAAGNYGTLSVLNWRTPLYPKLVSLFPTTQSAQMALVALALVAAAAGFFLLARHDRRLALVAIPFLLASVGGAFAPGTVYFSEYACGYLILVSASALGLGARKTGIATGALALFVRELALPYLVVCAFLAWREKRSRELVAWLAVAAAYAAFFLWHAAMVHAQLGADDFASPNGWLRFGGATFILSTAGYNGLLAGLPLWISAVILPLSILGLLAWRGTADVRILLTVAVYIVPFAIIGKPVNQYWGAIYTPLLTLGLPWAIPAIADLARTARRLSRPTPAVARS